MKVLYYARYGYYGTSIIDITGRADVGAGTFYLYFESKLWLYEYFLLQYNHEIRKHLEKVQAAGEVRDIDPEILRFALMGVTNVGLHWVVFKEEKNFDYVVERVTKFLEGMFKKCKKPPEPQGFVTQGVLIGRGWSKSLILVFLTNKKLLTMMFLHGTLKMNMKDGSCFIFGSRARTRRKAQDKKGGNTSKHIQEQRPDHRPDCPIRRQDHGGGNHIRAGGGAKRQFR